MRGNFVYICMYGSTREERHLPTDGGQSINQIIQVYSSHMQVYIYTNKYQYTCMHAQVQHRYTLVYAGIATPVNTSMLRYTSKCTCTGSYSYTSIRRYTQNHSVANKTDTSGEAIVSRGQTLFAQVLIDLDNISAGRL